METTIKIKKAEVYDEVAKLSGYVGAKTIEDTGLTYDRVFTTDDDRELLERFWRECTNLITGECKRFAVQVSTPSVSQEVDMNEVYSIALNMPSNFNTILCGDIESSFRSYCINGIVSKWFSITNKGDALYYMEEATRNVLDARDKLFHRVPPTLQLKIKN